LRVFVTRFDRTPADDGTVVGFDISASRGGFYLEATVTDVEAGARSDEQIARLAWAKVRPQAAARITASGARRQILGTELSNP